MVEDLKKYKLYYLQKKYNKIVNIIQKLEEHYENLYNENIIDKTSDYANILYDIIKNLNSYYNSIINNSYYEVNIFENIPLKRIFVDINNNIYFTN